MMMDDYDGQMMFVDLVGLKLPDIRLTDEEKPRKKLTQETCLDRESNPGPLRDKRSCYQLLHSGGLFNSLFPSIIIKTPPNLPEWPFHLPAWRSTAHKKVYMVRLNNFLLQKD